MAELPSDGLTPKQEQAIVALLSEPTVAKAAEVVAINVRTIYRWLEVPAFARHYRRLRRENFSQAMSLTHRYAPMAVTTLARIMADPSAPHAARVSAASTLLKFSRESIELDELTGRVDTLEMALSVETSAKTIARYADQHGPKLDDGDGTGSNSPGDGSCAPDAP